MTSQEILDFYLQQLKEWPLAATNHDNLDSIKKKPFAIGEFQGFIQYNPARAVSSLSKVDAKSISRRPCFLCRHHRPEQQAKIEILPGWDLLVNPYPIVPFHFTIAGIEHKKQELNIGTGKKLASLLEGMTVFYNSDGAGASAPDHIHFQAAPTSQLPLINFIETRGEEAIELLPYKIIVNPDEDFTDTLPSNSFFWLSRSGEIKSLVIPRRTHRPKEFFLDPPQRLAVSPGALDMAGIVVTPYEEDFFRLDSEKIKEIYSQVAFNA